MTQEEEDNFLNQIAGCSDFMWCCAFLIGNDSEFNKHVNSDMESKDSLYDFITLKKNTFDLYCQNIVSRKAVCPKSLYDLASNMRWFRREFRKTYNRQQAGEQIFYQTILYDYSGSWLEIYDYYFPTPAINPYQGLSEELISGGYVANCDDETLKYIIEHKRLPDNVPKIQWTGSKADAFRLYERLKMTNIGVFKNCFAGDNSNIRTNNSPDNRPNRTTSPEDEDDDNRPSRTKFPENSKLKQILDRYNLI